MDLEQHLAERGVDLSLYPNSIVLDRDSSVVTFLCWNLSGQLTGYQRYNPLSNDKKSNDPSVVRYFTRNSPDRYSVFGLESIKPDTRVVYVVEGVFKATKLHALGLAAIATLTSTPKPLKSWFRIMSHQYRLIAIGDPDQAGQKLVNMVGKGFLSPNDLDEMTDQEILDMLDDHHG